MPVSRPHLIDRGGPERLPLNPERRPLTENAVPRASGEPLEASVQALLSSRLGHDFGQIRVHRDEAAARSAEELQARAYTHGHHIVFGRGAYAPGTNEGQRLLFHEAAHVLHSVREPMARPGVAPPDADAERKAEKVSRATAPEPLDLRGWGPRWQIHRAPKVSKKGKLEHRGGIDEASGVPTGTIEVRTGEEVELKPGATIPNLIAIEYSGTYSAGNKWLQFVWFEMTAVTPKGKAVLSGSIPTTSGKKPFTTSPASPDWTVDSASTSDPFYEAAGLAIRSSSATTIFDAPGGTSATPLAQSVFNAGIGATSVTFTAHFETYFIQGGTAAYVVPWQGSTVFTLDKAGKVVAGSIGYTVGKAGEVSGIPAHLKTILHTAYSSHKHIK